MALSYQTYITLCIILFSHSYFCRIFSSFNLDFETDFEILKLHQFKIIFLVAHITTFVMLIRMMSDYNVETINDGLNEFNVEFHGPKESTVFTLPLL